MGASFTVDTVNRYGFHALAAVLVPSVALTARSANEKLTDKEREFLNRELEKRRKKLSEMITFVESHLDELEEKRRKRKGRTASCSSIGSPNSADEDVKAASDDGPGEGQREGGLGMSKASEAPEGATSSTATPAAEQEQDDADDLDVQIRFGEIFSCCVETEEIDKSNENLGRGLSLSARLMKLELEKVCKKTERGDSQFRDGGELDDLLKSHERFLDALRMFKVPHEDRPDLELHTAELTKVIRSAERVSQRIRNADFIKAAKLVLLAKENLPFIALSTAISAASGVLNSMEILFRTQSVEIFRKKDWRWPEFKRIAKAVLLTRALSCAMSILNARVDVLGNSALGHTIRTEMYKALLRQDFEWYRLGQKDARDVNEIFMSIFRVPNYVSQFISTPREVINLVTNIVTQLAIIRQQSSRLLYAMMALYWMKFGAGKLLHWLQNHLSKTFFNKIITPNHWIFMEPIYPENLQTVRSFAAEDKAISTWNVYWKSVTRQQRQGEILDSTFSPIHQAVDECGSLGENLWAGSLVRDGDMQAADMESAIYFANRVSSDVHGATKTFSRMRNTFAPLAKAWDIVSLKPKIGMEGGIIPEEGRAKGEITFEGVSFKYPTGNQVLRSVSFTVTAGKVCGITGTTGGGKSTIFKLIERFYDTKEGTVRLDGRDVRELNPCWLRRQISVVSQKPRFLNLPLRENLTYGCSEEPSTEAIEDACKAANIHDLVFNNKEKFPAGLYTHVSGETLSGGELQRLSIARAILMDAPILLLDEATSALDSESQAAVNEALQNLMRGRTVLSVAHRLEAIKDSDIILCLAPYEDPASNPATAADTKADGKEKEQEEKRKGFTVVEEGTHSELVALGKVYAGLYKKQIESTSAGKVNGKGAEGCDTSTMAPDGNSECLSQAAGESGDDRTSGESTPGNEDVGAKGGAWAASAKATEQDCKAETPPSGGATSGGGGASEPSAPDGPAAARPRRRKLRKTMQRPVRGAEQSDPTKPKPTTATASWIWELKSVQQELQDADLDDLRQQGLVERLEVLIQRMDRSTWQSGGDGTDFLDVDVAYGRSTTTSKTVLQRAVRNVIIAQRLAPGSAEKELPTARSARSALLLERAWSNQSLGRRAPPTPSGKTSPKAGGRRKVTQASRSTTSPAAYD